MATHQKKHIQNRQSKFNEFILKSEKDGEDYAIINKAVGSDARFEVTIISSGLITVAKARGILIKGPRKRKLDNGSVVLIQKDNTFTAEDKYYIIHKYDDKDVKRLESTGEIKVNTINDNDSNYSFDENNIDDI